MGDDDGALNDEATAVALAESATRKNLPRTVLLLPPPLR